MNASFDAAPFHSLFRLLAEIRAASLDSLDELFFQRVFVKQCRRSTAGMLARLVTEGFLARMDLKQARVIYHLTRRSLATIEDAGIDAPENLRRRPTDVIGQFLWLRASMRAEHSRRGFTVGRGPREAYALRRFVIDSVERSSANRPLLAELRADPVLCPPMSDGCERCGFIAPYGLRAQLVGLPVQHIGQPEVPIVLRSADPESRYDRRHAAWASKGPRHQLLDAAFSEDGLKDLWPIANTTRVIEVRPDLQLYMLRSDACAPAWECGVLGAGQPKAPRERAKALLPERNEERAVHERDERRASRERAKPAPIVTRREEDGAMARADRAPRIQRDAEVAPRRRR